MSFTVIFILICEFSWCNSNVSTIIIAVIKVILFYVIVRACRQCFMQFILVCEDMTVNICDYVMHEPKASALYNRDLKCHMSMLK